MEVPSMAVRKTVKRLTAFRLSGECFRLLKSLALFLGFSSKTAVVELAVREAAEKRGVKS